MTEPAKSLTELLERTSARRILEAPPPEDLGLAEDLPFPFLALVDQQEMKLALLLGLINPNIGGVLLIGPRGTGKTTAVRSLSNMMPEVERSLCAYGCLPEDIETGGIDAVCPACAEKYARKESLIYLDRVRLIELPLNARMEDVVGGIDERAAIHNRLRLERGLLARADRNLLYVDEVNLLSDEIVDAILDAAAQGRYTGRRGPLSATYRARFVLIGSMNPEEGRLRPQILDRFGLRVFVRGLDSRQSRLEAYERAVAYQNNPREVVNTYADATEAARIELEDVRKALPSVSLTKEAQNVGLKMIEELGIDSLRAEITLFEAARAHAIADGRKKATPVDVRKVAPLAIRLRRSHFIRDFFQAQQEEEAEMAELLESLSSKARKRTPSKSTRKKTTQK